MIITKRNLYLIIIAAVTSISSCSIKPEKLTKSDKVNSYKNVLERLHVNKSNKTLNIDLQKAISFAIDNNLEYKLKKIEAALAYNQFDLAKLDLYPKMDAGYRYDHRYKDYVKTLGTQAGEESDAQSLLPHTIQSGEILFNWNLLDFGVSYILAKQASDRYLLAQEQRKQIAAKLVNDVVKNYLLAYYGQALSKVIKDLEVEVDTTLKLSDISLKEKIGDSNEILQFKKNVIDDFRAAKDHLIYFNQSRDKLLSLLNYNTNKRLENVKVVLAPPGDYLTNLPVIKSDLIDLDSLALFYRPELNQSLYKINETKKQKTLAVLERLPSLGFNFGYNYNSDKFLLHQSWLSDNISIAWNLLNLATIPAAMDTAETEIEAAKLTYLASCAVILGEVRVLLYNYNIKKYDYTIADKSSKFADDLYQNSLNSYESNILDKQSLVINKLSTINAELGKLRVFTDTRNILEDIILSLGLYHSSGELVKKEYVDTAIIHKWMDKFTSSDFDKLIKSEYLKISSADVDLHSIKSHKKEHSHNKEPSKPMEHKKPLNHPEKKKHESHS